VPGTLKNIGVSSSFEKVLAASPVPALGGLELEELSPPPEQRKAEVTACFHCGEACPEASPRRAEKFFCCQGCLAVHDILAASGLDHFYTLAEKPGFRVRGEAKPERWAYLDAPAVLQQMLDFTDGKQSRVTLRVPAIHCVACVWLLENLFRLHPGIGESQVNFARQEVAVRFAPEKISLSGLVTLLASIGYEPQFTLGATEHPVRSPETRRRWLQLGVAGFGFGNIMLFSIPLYLGLDSLSAGGFGSLFGYLSLALALPVVLYSASDYWKGALLALRQRMLTLDVPIALGLGALYLQSAAEIVTGRGAGYLDSLAGLIFFLLCGRAFQQKTFERMAFDRDYKSFFPLATLRKTASGEESAALSELEPGDHLVIRHGELIPADSKLLSGDGLIDYSFVTGESQPVSKKEGEHLYAGGKQAGAAIEVEMARPVSQSYLASLWDHQVFRKPRQDDLNTLTNGYSRRFTRLVIAIAIGAGLFWVMTREPSRGLKAFTSVLIVACPCALALAAPFALGTVQRLLARRNIFLKNTLVLERLAQVDTIIFDKTGTLTSAQSQEVKFSAAEGGLTLCSEERRCIASLASQSTHPNALRIRRELWEDGSSLPPVGGFREVPGCGIEGEVGGCRVQLGSGSWLRAQGVQARPAELNGSASYVAVDGECKGAFLLTNPLRERTKGMLEELASRYELALLSGDNEREREQFGNLLGCGAHLHFNQSPVQKLEFIQQMQRGGGTVMMVGDGLNDAGALKQSDVGIAVVEKLGIFSPASDVILQAEQVADLQKLLALARTAAKIVRLSFLISATYNAVGISIAAAGILSPLICAVLMPLSSASVVIFACGAGNWAARRHALAGKEPAPCR
jgi:Cu+-exporting ATPase